MQERAHTLAGAGMKFYCEKNTQLLDVAVQAERACVGGLRTRGCCEENEHNFAA